MSLDPDKQSRTCGTKVRTGCLTCKSRRLKCDEDFQKGGCQRCRKSKRTCQTSPARNTELRIVHYVSKTPIPTVCIPDANERENRYFHRFCTWTALDLAGSFSSEFFTRYTVTIAMSEPAIKHAVIALSALHEQYQARRSLSFTDPGMQYPLSQCTKAISLLTKAMYSNDEWAFPDTALIACMLFCAFDSMSYHLDSAIAHLKGGINILIEQLQWSRSRSTSRSPSPYDISPSMLQPLFVRLDTQGLQLTESLSTAEDYPFPYQLQTSRFNNVTEAHRVYSEAFNLILRTIYDADADHFEDECDPATKQNLNRCRYEARSRDIGLLYSSWCTSFDEFIGRGIAAEDVQSCVLMQIWRLATNMNVQIDLKKGDMDYDRFQHHFEDIVRLVYEFLLISTAHHQSRELHQLSAPSVSNVSSAAHGGFFYHHGPNSGDLRSGNLHLHPDRTPFISSPVLDANLHNTTSLLLAQARTTRPTYCAHLDLPSTIIISLEHTRILLPQLRPSFSFSTGLIVPLYVTISRCRDPLLRRRALTLMQHCNRREGLWDASLAARLGERVIEIEERQALQILQQRENDMCVFEESSAFCYDFDAFDGAALGGSGGSGGVLHSGLGTQSITSAAQIPNEARVRLIRPTFMPDRRSKERYFMGWAGSWEDAGRQDERWIEEDMEW